MYKALALILAILCLVGCSKKEIETNYVERYDEEEAIINGDVMDSGVIIDDDKTVTEEEVSKGTDHEVIIREILDKFFVISGEERGTFIQSNNIQPDKMLLKVLNELPKTPEEISVDAICLLDIVGDESNKEYSYFVTGHFIADKEYYYLGDLRIKEDGEINYWRLLTSNGKVGEHIV